MEINKTEKNIQHPLENVFDIEAGTTVIEQTTVSLPAVVLPPSYDDKDDEIETRLEEIYAVAMSNVATISDEIERVEGKYKSRIGEVTATMLGVALGAVREKRELKQHKDKNALATQTAKTPGTVNNNLIVADRNEILRIMQGATIDGECTQSDK